MSQLEILNLARSCRQTIDSDFAQVITITFAMVVAIYYFLHQAGVRMKIFASASTGSFPAFLIATLPAAMSAKMEAAWCSRVKHLEHSHRSFEFY